MNGDEMKSCFLSALPLFAALALTACATTEPYNPTGSGSGSNGASSSSGSGAGAGSGAKGTGSSEEGEALFAVKGDATPDEIFGVWVSPSQTDGPITFDTRTRFSTDTMESAVRCTFRDSDDVLVASASSNARVSASEVAVLEANSDERVKGDLKCSVRINPTTTKACEAGMPKRDCFALDGTTLTLYGGSELDDAKLTKVSD
jgi:hypothetical protein